MGLGIALISYNGRIGWGFNANPDIILDLEVFMNMIQKSFHRVAHAAGLPLGQQVMDSENRIAETSRVQYSRLSNSIQISSLEEDRQRA